MSGDTYLISRIGERYQDQPRVKEHYRFKSLYFRTICRAVNSYSLPVGSKLKMLGADSWDQACDMFKKLPGYSENLHRAGMRLELIDASLPFPECVHISNLRYGKTHAPRKPRKVEDSRISVVQLVRLIEVIHLKEIEGIKRISAKELHDIARNCLKIPRNKAIISSIRAIMDARGWKAWQTYDECWYERL